MGSQISQHPIPSGSSAPQKYHGGAKLMCRILNMVRALQTRRFVVRMNIPKIAAIFNQSLLKYFSPGSARKISIMV
jgi:hypothetical protein